MGTSRVASSVKSIAGIRYLNVQAEKRASMEPVGSQSVFRLFVRYYDFKTI